MDARFMQMHNFVLTREIIINSIFPVDRMRELNFRRETAVFQGLKILKDVERWIKGFEETSKIVILLSIEGQVH